MAKLETIYLINAAGFDYLEFPVGGHTQVIGVNGHGKSTLLRTVLFFYLGTNDKAPYALDTTKLDFVSYYLGEPPSYLVYEVSRPGGQPGWHVAVTRSTGKIQFCFVDAPYQRRYYIDGHYVQPVEAVLKRLGDEGCPVDVLNSYDEFTRRIYGMAEPTYTVFKPAVKSAGANEVLGRIISGIFTVSRLDADKLKSVLVCGLHKDALAVELDLLKLKSQLQNFRRVHRAVKIYLRYEQQALELVDLLAQYEGFDSDRRHAIEALARMAKLLPGERRRIQGDKARLEQEKQEALTAFQTEEQRLREAITALNQQLGGLEENITRGETAAREYAEREIDRKAKELEELPQLESQRQGADREYTTLTEAASSQKHIKEALADKAREEWHRLRAELLQRKGQVEAELAAKFSTLDQERETDRNQIENSRGEELKALSPRQEKLRQNRGAWNLERKAFNEDPAPRELKELERRLAAEAGSIQREDLAMSALRGEIALAQQKAERAREKLEREARDETEKYQADIARLGALKNKRSAELDNFDASLARFYQSKAPECWPSAAKTLNRQTLFQNAAKLGVRRSTTESSSIWGIEFDASGLPVPEESYDRDELASGFREARENFKEAQDNLQAAQRRHITDADALEKSNAALLSELNQRQRASADRRKRAVDERERIESDLTNLRTRIETAKKANEAKLERKQAELNSEEEQLSGEQCCIEELTRERLAVHTANFTERRTQLELAAQSLRGECEQKIQEARWRHEEDLERIERDFRQALAERGVDPDLVEAAHRRLQSAEKEIERISGFQKEVDEYRLKQREWIEPLVGWKARRKAVGSERDVRERSLCELNQRRDAAQGQFQARHDELENSDRALAADEQALTNFLKDLRFVQETGLFDREDLAPTELFQPGAVQQWYEAAGSAHQQREALGGRGRRLALEFLNHFDAETLERQVLGFSPIREPFNWYIFVGSELKLFVDNRGIRAMALIQTQEFEQLVRNICGKNADFQDGIRRVNQTAELVQRHIREHNFVDVIDSVELQVSRVDNSLTQTLASMEAFEGLSFQPGHDLFSKQADRAQADRAIESFDKLLKEIDTHKGDRLRLTDYFEFQIRISENGHDMGWRRSLDHIGSTGTDYLVKMLIYLSLVEIYRERAIRSEEGAAVHCVLDETGVLAPKYVRSVLEYAASRGIVLITAGHSQQTAGFQNWVLVRKRGARFAGQSVLRRILTCD